MRLVKIFLSILLFILFVSCGIEDTLYFQEPKNLSYKNESYNSYLVFTGYNQEILESDQYLFCGYDVYYYFSNSDSKKRAQVKYPVLSTSSGGGNQSLVQIDELRFGRDIYDGVKKSSFVNAYQYISLPVTKTMIKRVLEEGNNYNVKVYFKDIAENGIVEDYTSAVDDSSGNNPYKKGSDDYILIDNMFPAYEEYHNVSWLTDVEEKDFLGFYDARYYLNVAKITPTVSGIYDVYRVYFYIVAKGFDSLSKSSLSNFTESSSSSTVAVDFYIQR